MESKKTLADKVAIGLSALCTIHCLILPFVLVAFPALTTLFVFDNEVFHFWLLFGVIPISLFALISGFAHHRNMFIVGLTGTGLCLLITALLIGHETAGESAEVILTVLGSILIATGHFYNLKHHPRF